MKEQVHTQANSRVGRDCGRHDHGRVRDRGHRHGIRRALDRPGQPGERVHRRLGRHDAGSDQHGDSGDPRRPEEDRRGPAAGRRRVDRVHPGRGARLFRRRSGDRQRHRRAVLRAVPPHSRAAGDATASRTRRWAASWQPRMRRRRRRTSTVARATKRWLSSTSRAASPSRTECGTSGSPRPACHRRSTSRTRRSRSRSSGSSSASRLLLTGIGLIILAVAVLHRTPAEAEARTKVPDAEAAAAQ